MHPRIRAFVSSGRLTAFVVSCTVAALAAGCSRVPAPVVQPSPGVTSTPVPERRDRLFTADEMLRRGCYDCLRDALAGYEALQTDPEVGTRAREAAVRTALLLAVRETELGLHSGGYIARARRLLGPVEQASPELPGLVEIAEVMANGPVGFTRTAGTDSQIAAMLTMARSQEQWASVLRNLMPQDLTASYLWLSLACGPYASTFPDRDKRDALLQNIAVIPLFAFKFATACGLTTSEPLEAMLAIEPRFGELNYHLGLFALGGETGMPPDLDAADARFRDAYAWRQDWPTLTLAIANVAMSAEDFPRAFEFYDFTLGLSKDDPDALTGTIRALTYSNRHTEAIAQADRLIGTGRNVGDAHYWRAMNFARLKEDTRAWTAIEDAALSLANADVPKLAGIIAINRRDWATARQRLELAAVRRRNDCETAYYLQAVLAEQRDWEATARVASDAGACFDTDESVIQQELAVVRASLMAADRRTRLVARREAQLVSNARMRATAWYNAAAANFNLSRAVEARRFAEKVADDAFYGDRARSLLERLK
ncbi:MAG: hypothetical protein ABL982_03430 [Vicinamibacterales bacterium]